MHAALHWFVVVYSGGGGVRGHAWACVIQLPASQISVGGGERSLMDFESN